MNHEELRDLAAGYALGGLDGEDRVRFEALLLAGDPDATAALREFEATRVGLARDRVEAPLPPGKAARRAQIDAEGRRPSAAPVGLARRGRSAWLVMWTVALAAGLAAIVVGLSISARYEKRLDALAREAATLSDTLAREEQVIALLRDPSTAIVSLAGPAPVARGRMLWNPRAGGLLVAAGLPPAPEGKIYQLWAIAGKEAPVSAGVFSADAGGTGSLRVPALPGVGKIDVFAVTLEPTGGLRAPSGKMYLAGKF
jgi:anti-sigma-K factor RskA